MLSKRWISLLSLAFSLLAGFYFISFAAKNMKNLPPVELGVGQVVAFLGSLLLWFLVVFFGATIWKMILSGLNFSVTWKDSLTIFGVSQFGKYLPGNVGHFFGRALLAKGVGIPPSYSAQSILLEVSWSVGIASVLAFFGLLLGYGVEVSFSMLLFLLAACFLFPWLTIWVVNNFFPRILNYFLGESELLFPGYGVVAKACALYLLTFFCVGLILDWHARTLFGAENSNILLATIFFSWSWVAGYITPGAPAGLGVREAVLVSTLSSLYGPGAAVGIAVSLRLVTTIGDGLIFLLALFARQRASDRHGVS